MNPGTKFTIHLQQLKTRLRGSAWPLTSADEEQPLRSELFSADQMEQHGRALAHTHKLASAQLPDQLLIRLAENETALVSVCRLLTAAVAAKRRITPAAEWLLDNFYLIEEQIRTAKRHLPKGYSRELPRLDDAPADLPMSSAGRPRVYDIALEIISHGDGRVDAEVLSRFVAAYQSITPLKLGELWATPIMLRLAVIENLRRVAGALMSAFVSMGPPKIRGHNRRSPAHCRQCGAVRRLLLMSMKAVFDRVDDLKAVGDLLGRSENVKNDVPIHGP